jgi:hypothetical protein
MAAWVLTLVSPSPLGRSYSPGPAVINDFSDLFAPIVKLFTFYPNSFPPSYVPGPRFCVLLACV